MSENGTLIVAVAVAVAEEAFLPPPPSTPAFPQHASPLRLLQPWIRVDRVDRVGGVGGTRSGGGVPYVC